MIEDIIDILYENGLIQNDEDVKSNGSLIEAAITYVFDQDELAAAKSFAEEDNEEGIFECLKDIASDFVNDVVDEITDKYSVKQDAKFNIIQNNKEITMSGKIIFVI